MSVDAGLEFLKTQSGQIPVHVPDISIVRTLCSLILAHLNIVSENGGFGKLYIRQSEWRSEDLVSCICVS